VRGGGGGGAGGGRTGEGLGWVGMGWTGTGWDGIVSCLRHSPHTSLKETKPKLIFGSLYDSGILGTWHMAAYEAQQDRTIIMAWQ